jgi:hypothetical protein
MTYRRSAIVTIVAGLALFAAGGGSFAGDVKWGAPNVPGQPGYKEPPKGDEVQVHPPRPAQDPKLGVYHKKAEPSSNR